MNAATFGRSALTKAVDRYESNACDSCPRGVLFSARPGNLRMAYAARTAAQECEPTLGAPLSSPAQRSTRDVERRPTRGLQIQQPLDGSSPDPLRVRFGPIELDEAEARLTVNGHPVPLQPKPFAVLCALVRAPQTLLTTNALLDAVWGHRFVTDSVLKTAISEVRAALDDDPKQPRYIETVSRRGYRFIGATIGASSQRTPPVERNLAAGRDHPALLALTALCRGDAAVADLIRAVATTLEREPLVLNES